MIRVHYILILVIMIGIIGRCVHLFDEHYYVLSADSYLFHYIAGTIQTGADPVLAPFAGFHTGISYPVGILAKITGLYVASCIVPLLIHVVMSLVIYWFAARHWGKLVGVISVLIWALIPQASLVTATGYIDRDGLSLLIMTVGMITMYESWIRGGNWHYSGPLMFSGLLFLMWAQWLWIGPLLMLAVLVLVVATASLFRRANRIPVNNCKMVAMAILGLLPFIFFTDIFQWHHINLLGGHQTDIGEATPLRLLDPLVWWSWAIATTFFGLYLTSKGYYEPDIVVSTWLIVFLGLSIISNRCGLFALPPVCILSGITVKWLVAKFQIVEFNNQPDLWKYKTALGVALGSLLLGSIYSVGALHNTIRYTPDNDWQEVLAYIQHETGVNDQVAVFGDYGYWLMDLGERSPSSYGGPIGDFEVMARIYCADNPEDLAENLDKLQCDYFICSKQEYEGPAYASMSNYLYPYWDTLETIDNSLIKQLLYRDIDSIKGLEVVFRNDSVILAQQATNTPQCTTSNDSRDHISLELSNYTP